MGSGEASGYRAEVWREPAGQRPRPSLRTLQATPRGTSRGAQLIVAVIVGLITGVLLLESYGAMAEAARAGGRAIPELWPLGTEALALSMEVSVLEASA
jgi:hypothetical protein